VRRLATLAGAALLAACGASGTRQMSDWERQNPALLATPETVKIPMPPALPRPENLVEFYVGPTASFRYFIDVGSLGVLYTQKEVRFVLVARSPSGVENVSFEAIRCPDLHRLYAVADDSGKWSVRPGEWQEIQRRTGLGWPSVLAREYFCPHRDPLQSAAEGVEALRLGGHPLVRTEQKNLGR
jgi:CNP1-like family